MILPANLDDYMQWKLGFSWDEKKDVIEKLVGDNGLLICLPL